MTTRLQSPQTPGGPRLPRASIRPLPEPEQASRSTYLPSQHPSIPATVCWTPAPVQFDALHLTLCPVQRNLLGISTLQNLHAAQPLSVQMVLSSLCLLSTLHSLHSPSPPCNLRADHFQFPKRTSSYMQAWAGTQDVLEVAIRCLRAIITPSRPLTIWDRTGF